MLPLHPPTRPCARGSALPSCPGALPWAAAAAGRPMGRGHVRSPARAQPSARRELRVAGRDQTRGEPRAVMASCRPWNGHPHATAFRLSAPPPGEQRWLPCLQGPPQWWVQWLGVPTVAPGPSAALQESWGPPPAAVGWGPHQLCQLGLLPSLLPHPLPSPIRPAVKGFPGARGPSLTERLGTSHLPSLQPALSSASWGYNSGSAPGALSC